VSYEIALRFHPHQKNPARPSGLGVYRVVNCIWAAPTDPLIFVWPAGIFLDEAKPAYLLLRTERAYKVRSRVDPRKVLGL
jgi:hypothetical protein